MNASNIKKFVPWQLKIASKLVLARIPVRHSFWRRLSLFQHGFMDDPKYALDIFQRHFDRAHPPHREGGFVALELGPGDSVCSAQIAKALGATRTYLVDIAPFASREMSVYQRMAQHLQKQGLETPATDSLTSIEQVLDVCQAQYLVGGLDSLRALPSASVDFVWSHAVLEHVRRAEFLPIMVEIRRLMRPDGVCSHCIDLRDHLNDALHNLRFRDETWESNLVARSGFYTNRLRCSEIIDLFEQAGFSVEVISVARWPKIPTSRARFAPMFRKLSDEDLLIHEIDLVARPISP